MSDYKETFKRKTIIKWKLTHQGTKDFSKLSGVSRSSLYRWAKQFGSDLESQINSAKRLNLPFELNTMQEEALLKQGKNIILNAPTGSGKTEAILLNCLPGHQYYYFLPTVTSCVFMYFRLCQLENLNIEIATSILRETSFKANYEDGINIKIITPDPCMISYLKEEGFVGENLILDEVDNYPEMVQTALREYVEDVRNHSAHFIIASATLNKELMACFQKGFQEISYHRDLKLLKHKFKPVRINQIARIIRENRGKKIGIICNMISNMDMVYERINRQDVEVMVHHARIDEHQRLLNEERLFKGDFTVLLSNDLISYSVDVNFDILIMEASDQMALNIQRLGRNNRYNMRVTYTNLYVLKKLDTPHFADHFKKIKNENRLLKNSLLSFSGIERMRKNLPDKELPTIHDIFDFWEECRDLGLAPSLRKAPLTFKEPFIKEVEIWEDGIKKTEWVRTYQLFKSNRGIPYAHFPYLTEEAARNNGEKIIQLQNNTYRIVGTEDAFFIVEPVKSEADTRWGTCPKCNLLTSWSHSKKGICCELEEKRKLELEKNERLKKREQMMAEFPKGKRFLAKVVRFTKNSAWMLLTPEVEGICSLKELELNLATAQEKKGMINHLFNVEVDQVDGNANVILSRVGNVRETQDERQSRLARVMAKFTRG